MKHYGRFLAVCILVALVGVLYSCKKEQKVPPVEQSKIIAESDIDNIHIVYSTGAPFETRSDNIQYTTVTASDGQNTCQLVVDKIVGKDNVIYSNHYDCFGNLLATLTFIDNKLVDIDVLMDEGRDYLFEPGTRSRREGESFSSCYFRTYHENEEFLDSEDSGIWGVICDAPVAADVCYAVNVVISVLICLL